MTIVFSPVVLTAETLALVLLHHAFQNARRALGESLYLLATDNLFAGQARV